MVSFRKGITYEIVVKSQPRVKANDKVLPDVDLIIFDSNGDPVASDLSEGPDSQVRWNPDQDSEYRVEIGNLDPNMRVTSSVTIREEAPPKEIKKETPLPADVKIGMDTFDPPNNPLPSGQEHEFKLRVKAGHRAKVSVSVFGKVKVFNVSLSVTKDEGGELIASDARPGMSPSVTFTRPKTEIVRVRIRNAGNVPVRCTVAYDGG
jgi:hypothetical protein